MINGEQAAGNKQFVHRSSLVVGCRNKKYRMKRSLIIGVICCLGKALFAQQDPTIMRINGREIPRSEFEYFYKQNCLDKGLKTTPKEYAEAFVVFQLKADAAKMAHLDTTSTFKKNLSDYQKRLSGIYLTNDCNLDSCARSLFNQKTLFSRPGQVQIRQIVKYLPQSITSRRLHSEEVRMDSIYQLIKGQPNVDFGTWINQFSDDRQTLWIGRLEAVSEFEKIAFTLQKGEMSTPFVTPEGIHILQVIDRKEPLSFEQVQDDWKVRFARRQENESSSGMMVERLKKEYSYTPDLQGVEELLSQGETDKTLFLLNGKPYTGLLFKRFAESYPQAVQRQLDAFVVKSVLDCANQVLSKKFSTESFSFHAYRDMSLVTELTRQTVDLPAVNDKAGLATYFKFHQPRYRWDKPRFKGALLHCVDKNIAKQVKRLLKKTPEKDWVESAHKAFNQLGKEQVRIEQKTFAEGDNKYIDKLIFKRGKVESEKSHPFTITVGKKQKGPSDYKEVLSQVQKDYKDYLTMCWIKDLRAKSKVEINEEVLKTVNNH